MSAFYPGAGYDFSPISLFPHIKEWYFMDSLPHSEYRCNKQNNFVNNLKRIANQFSLELVSNENNRLVFSNKELILTYYINSVFPNDLEKLNIKYSTLYLCGYGPDEGWPNGFLDKFNHIITQKHNLNDIKIKNKNIKISYVERDINFDYWLPENMIPENISKYHKITHIY